jgi:hypothetical protein
MPDWYEDLLKRKKKVESEDEAKRNQEDLAGRLSLPWYERLFRSLPVSPFYWKTPEEQQYAEDTRRMEIYAEETGQVDPKAWAKSMLDKAEQKIQPSIRATGNETRTRVPYYTGRESYEFSPISPEQKLIDIGSTVLPIPMGEQLVGAGIKAVGRAALGGSIMKQVGKGVAGQLTQPRAPFLNAAMQAGKKPVLKATEDAATAISKAFARMGVGAAIPNAPSTGGTIKGVAKEPIAIGHVPEWGTTNQYIARNPYRKQLEHMGKTKKFDLSVIKEADRWEMGQVLKDKPAYLNDNLPDMEIIKFAKDNNLPYGYAVFPSDPSQAVIVVAKNKQTLRKIIDLAAEGNKQRELGLALGYLDTGKPPTAAPKVTTTAVKTAATGQPIDFTLYRGTSGNKSIYTVREYGRGKYYYADMGEEGTAEKLAESFATGHPTIAYPGEAAVVSAVEKSGGKVSKEFVHLDNPYVTDRKNPTLTKVVNRAMTAAKDFGLTGDEYDKYVAESIPKYLKGKGYDGLVVRDTEGAFTVIPYVKTSAKPIEVVKPLTPAASALKTVRNVAETADEETLLKDIATRLSSYKPLREEADEAIKALHAKQSAIFEEAYKWAQESAGMSKVEALRYATNASKEAGKAVMPDKPLPGMPERAGLPIVSSKEENILHGIIDRELQNIGKKERSFDRRNAKEGLKKLLSATEIPAPHEMELLEEAFGFNFVTESLKRNRTTGQKVLSALFQFVNIPRTIKSAWDLSAPLRQGAVVGFSHPITAARDIGFMFKALKSEDTALFIDDLLYGRIGNLTKKWRFSPEDALKAKEKASRYLDHFGFQHSLREGGTKIELREEAYLSGLFETPVKIFGKKTTIGRITGIRQSERAYATYLNKLRRDVFDQVADKWEKSGKYVGKDGKFAQKEYDNDLTELARFINRATGRGELWTGEYTTKAFKTGHPGGLLNIPFFSPRLLTSRLLVFGSLFSSSKAVRKQAARDLAIWAGTTGTIIGLLAVSPDITVERDPRSSQFAKIRVKDTYIDITAGYQPLIRYAAQLVAGKKSSSGWISEKEPIETAGRFAWSKLNPMFSSIVAAVVGKTFTGEEIKKDWDSLWQQLSDFIEPMAVSNIRQAYMEYGNVPESLFAAPDLFGAGTSTYDSSDSVVQDFYAITSQLNKDVKSWKDAQLAGNLKEIQKLEKEHPELKMEYDASIHDYYSKTNRILNSYATEIYELNQQIHAAELDPNIEDDDRERLTEELERQKAVIATQAILEAEGLYNKDWITPGFLPEDWDELYRAPEQKNETPTPKKEQRKIDLPFPETGL